MNTQNSLYRFLKLAGWGLLGITLLLFMLLPLKQTLLPLDHSGEAFAQTVGPEVTVTLTPQPILTPGAPVGPGLSDCSCFRPPIGASFVTVNIREGSTLNFLEAIVPPAQPVTPTVPIVVPSGLITAPVGTIDFDFGVDRRGTLVVPAHPTRPLLVRLETLSNQDTPLPIDQPGVIAGLPAGSNATQVLHVFKLDLFYADTGEEINIHERELMIAICPRTDHNPERPLLLRFDEGANQYEIVDQLYSRFNLSGLAYVPRTSTFVLVSVAGSAPQISPLLLPGTNMPTPPQQCPEQKDPCQCDRLPSGITTVETSMLGDPPAGIPPLTNDGFLGQIPASTLQSFAPFYVPSGAIEQSIGVFRFNIGCNDSSLLVATDRQQSFVVRFQTTPVDQPPMPLDDPGAIPDLPAALVTDRIMAIFSLDLFDAATGDPVDQHQPELVVRICPRIEYSPETPILLRFDEAANQYTIPPQQYAHPVRCLVAYLPDTSPFVLSTLIGDGSNVVPTPVIPAGLPRTGEEVETNIPASPGRFWWVALGGLALVLGSWQLIRRR